MAEPRVFVASSRESLPMVNVLKRALSDAHVVSWDDPGVFKAGQTFLDELVRLTQEFDLALFLYEKDDQVLSRGVASLAPRDNVVFEHGLFMSQLGRQRAFAIAPRGGVKVLTDLSGIKLLEYDESAKIADLRRELAAAASETGRTALAAALEAELKAALDVYVLPQIRENLVPLDTKPFGVQAGPPDVIGVVGPLARLMRTARTGSPLVVVEHLGLDLEVGWAIVRDRVLADPDVRDLVWRCLIVDPDSSALAAAASDSVSLGIARLRIAEIRKWCASDAPALAGRQVRFECRSYDSLPIVHGFLVRGAGLLWSMCDIRGGRLHAHRTQYWEFDDTSANSHIVQSFGNWFGHLFDTGKPIWPDQP